MTMTHFATARYASTPSYHTPEEALPSVRFEGCWSSEERRAIATVLAELEQELSAERPVPAGLGPAWTCRVEKQGQDCLYSASRVSLPQVLMARGPGGLYRQLQEMLRSKGV